MTIAEKLQTIISIKSDIKEAILDKGVSVTELDSFTSYADKIRNIETASGGSSGSDESLFIQYIEGTITDLVIPDGTTKISDYAFCHSQSLTSVTISDSVESVGSNAFWSCPKLQKVWLPSTVTTISANSSSGSPFYGSNLFCVIYTDVASEDDIPSGWGTYWNNYDSSTQLEIVYGSSYEEFLNDKNLFPDFSDYTEGEYTVSASSEYSSSYPAWKAFDGDTSTYWRSKNAPTEEDPQWIEIACGQSTTLSKLKLYFSLTSYMATDFVVQGSVNGEDWRDLAAVTDNANTFGTVDVDDSEAWNYFRIYFTGCSGSSMRLCKVSGSGKFSY